MYCPTYDYWCRSQCEGSAAISFMLGRDILALLYAFSTRYILPLNCRTAPSVNTFKIRLKTFLFDWA